MSRLPASLPSSARFFWMRLNVVSVASKVVLEGEPGQQCFGFPAEDGKPALIVVVDEGELNEGASTTNSIETVLQHLYVRWGDELPVTEALVVERDSIGSYDHAFVQWERSGTTPRVTVGWKPLRWPGVKPCSEQAFLAMFGERAQLVLFVLGKADPQG